MSKFKAGDVLYHTGFKDTVYVISIVPKPEVFYYLRQLTGPSKGVCFFKDKAHVERNCILSKSGKILYGT